MDWLKKAIFISILFFFAVQDVKSAVVNPKCVPNEQIDQNGTAIDYIFILDHSLKQEKIDKMRYVMKAASCDIPNGPQYRLKTIHVNSGGNAKTSGYKKSLEFPDTLQEDLPHVGDSNEACHRLVTVTNEMGTDKNSPTTTYLIMPIDADEACHPHDLFDVSNSNPNHHLALINMDGAPESSRISDMNLKWAKIDLNKEDLHKSKNFLQLQDAGEIMETIARWVQKTRDLTLLAKRTTVTTNTTYAAQVNSTVSMDSMENSTIPSEATTISTVKLEQILNQTTVATSTYTKRVTEPSGANSTSEGSTVAVNGSTVSIVNETETPELFNSTSLDAVNSTTVLDTVNSTVVPRIDTSSNDTVILPVFIRNGSLDNSTTTEASTQHIQNSTVVVTRIDTNTTVSPEGQETSTEASFAEGNTTVNSTVVPRIDTFSNSTVTQLNDSSTTSSTNTSIFSNIRNGFMKGDGIIFVNDGSTELPGTSVTPATPESTTAATEATEASNSTADSNQNNMGQANAQQMETSTETEEEAPWYGNYYILFGIIFLLLILIILIIVLLICCINRNKKGKYQLVEEETQHSPPTTTKPNGISYTSVQDENGYEVVNHEEMNEDQTQNAAAPPATQPLIVPLAAPQVTNNQQSSNQTNLASARPATALPLAPPAPRAPEGVMDPFGDAPVNKFYVNYKPIEVTPARQQTPTERSLMQKDAIAEPSGPVKKYDIGGAVDEMF